MFERSVQHIDELPLPEKDRKTTDVCCSCIGVAFALAMITLTFMQFQKDNHTKTTLFTDSFMRTCSGDLQHYPYVYFADPQDPSKRLCVKNCPTETDKHLSCDSFGGLPCDQLQAYPTTPQDTLLGGICMPTDGFLRNHVFTNAKLDKDWGLLEGLSFLKETLLLSMALGIIWVLVVQICTNIAVWLAVLGCSLMMLLIGMIPLLDKELPYSSNTKILMALVPLALMVFMSVTACFSQRQLKVSSVFLCHSAKFLRQSMQIFLFIPPMIILTLALLLICTLQHYSFKSVTPARQIPGDIFWRTEGSTALIVLNIVGAIWGVQFLRDTFNYFVSGNAVQCYFTHRQTQSLAPVKRFFRKNFGTVVAGSFLNAFLEPPAFFMEVLTCQPEGCCGRCSRPCYFLWGCCENVLDLARTDAYAYTNLTGIPFCNSSRNCQYLCNQSKLFIGRQSPMKIYRACSQLLLIGHQMLISYILMKSKYGVPSLWGLLLSGVLGYCVLGFFTNIHADAAEALQVCFFTEYQIENEVYEQMNRCPISMRQQVQQLDLTISRRR